MSRTAAPRHGRHIRAIPSHLFLGVGHIASSVSSLLAQGFELQSPTRPYVRASGVIVVRLVLRQRESSASACLTTTLRGALPAPLMREIFIAGDRQSLRGD